jgi:hypothetical protein
MSVPSNPSVATYPGLPALFDLADGVTSYPVGTSGNITGSVIVGTNNSFANLQASSSYYQNGLVVSNTDGVITITGNQIEETPDSPILERAEQATCTKKFIMPYETAVSLQRSLPRGTVLADIAGDTLRVLSTTLARQKPNMATLTIVSEGLSFDVPPDEFSCEPIELGANIKKYPRYYYSLLPQSADTVAQAQAKQAIVRAIQTYEDSPFFPTSATLNGLLTGQVHNNIVSQLNIGTLVYTVANVNYQSQYTVTADTSWPIQDYADPLPSTAFPPKAQKNGDVNPVNIQIAANPVTFDQDPVVRASFAAAQEIISKLWRQEDTPYDVAFQITWSTYSYTKPYYNPGGYIEDPIFDTNGFLNPGLPDYFASGCSVGSTGIPIFDRSNNTLFDAIATINPQCYSPDGTAPTDGLPQWGNYDISWLRKADVVSYERTWFKTTRTWIGAPQAHWDTDLYTRNNRPNTGAGTGSSVDYPYGYNIIS